MKATCTKQGSIVKGVFETCRCTKRTPAKTVIIETIIIIIIVIIIIIKVLIQGFRQTLKLTRSIINEDTIV